MRCSAVALLDLRFNGDVENSYNTERLHWNSGGVGQVHFQNQSRLRLTFVLPEFTDHPAVWPLRRPDVHRPRGRLAPPDGLPELGRRRVRGRVGLGLGSPPIREFSGFFVRLGHPISFERPSPY
jgi:hypothetical protein